MNIRKHINTILSAALLSLAIYGCNDKWDEHVAVTDEIVNDNLFEQLSANNEVSEFNKLLVKTGYDKIISASKTYTVFAPNNDIIATLSPSLIDDTTRLKAFVANHIAISAYRTDMASDSVKLKMLSGKNLIFLQNEIDEIQITTANKFAANGIYHVINGALTPRSSIWEYLLANNTNYRQAAFITSLDTLNIYPNASANTGIPTIDNEFTRETYNIRNEEVKYTMFLMQNTALTTEVNKLLPYFLHPSLDTNTNIATQYALRDLVFPGELRIDNLPDTLVSRFGVKVPINRNNIVETVKTSNGLIHIVSNMNVELRHRLVPTRIEGENPRQFIPGDRRGNTYYRNKRDPQGILFNDLMVQNHGVSLFEVGYQTPLLYSTTYRVFWRAINDIQTNVFQQRLRVGGVRNAAGLVVNTIITFPYINVNVNDYSEVYIGDFTLTSTSNIPLALIGAAVTTNGNNTVTLDYLRLVPTIK
jgi:hypothetical protein